MENENLHSVRPVLPALGKQIERLMPSLERRLLPKKHGKVSVAADGRVE